MGVAWLNPDGELASRPTSLPGVAFPSDETLESRGWRKVEVPGCDQKYWVRAGDTFREMTQDERAALAAAEQAAADQAVAARVSILAAQYGEAVAALHGALAEVGWSLPCSAADVSADLIRRSMAGQLSPEQEKAKGNVAAIYMLLQSQGLSNADIAVVWEAISP